jgi:hypothetical protein
MARLLRWAECGERRDSLNGGLLLSTIGSAATPQLSLRPFHTDGLRLKARCGFRGLWSFRQRHGRAQPLANIAGASF